MKASELEALLNDVQKAKRRYDLECVCTRANARCAGCWPLYDARNKLSDALLRDQDDVLKTLREAEAGLATSRFAADTSTDERPSWVHCVLIGESDGELKPVRKTWCGRMPPHYEWTFLDASHAALNASHRGRLVCCLACRAAITSTLMKHELTALGTRKVSGDCEEEPENTSKPGITIRVRPEVARFAVLMEEKLSENDHKGGWKDCDPTDLLRRLTEEAEELGRCRLLACVVRKQERPGDPLHMSDEARHVGREAADVANFAMMIADVCGALGPVKL